MGLWFSKDSEPVLGEVIGLRHCRLGVALAAILALSACAPDNAADDGTEFATELGVDFNRMVKSETGLFVQELAAGEGEVVESGQLVSVQYTGWLPDGTEFANSAHNGQPMMVSLGAGQPIPGFDEGVQGMKVGGRRKIVVPASLGFGEAGGGSAIPPNSWLVFDVELTEVLADMSDPDAITYADELGVDLAAMTRGEEGLIYQDLVVGEGEEVQNGQTVNAHYTGWLPNGTKFDSSVDRAQTFPFPVGQGRVIRGWDLGVLGMRVGGKRKLVIPPAIAYGMRGSPPVIPPNTTLVFDVEIVSIGQ